MRDADQGKRRGAGSETRRANILAAAAADRRSDSEPQPAIIRGASEPPPSIIHHPLVAISLILIVATAAQLAVWLVHVRLLTDDSQNLTSTTPPALLADASVFNAIDALIGQANTSEIPDDRASFAVWLIAALLSTVAWYAAARVMLGRTWGLWVGMVWGVSPLCAVLAQRPSPLTLPLVLVPTTWALMLAWSRSRHRRLAFAAGLAAGVTCVCAISTMLVMVLACLPLMIATHFRRKVPTGIGLLLVGAALPIAAVAMRSGSQPFTAPLNAFSTDWLLGQPDTPPSVAAGVRSNPAAATHPDAMLPVRLVRDAARRSPGELIGWFIGRVWQCTYATAGERFQRQMFAAQVALLLPAMWGLLVCLRVAEWRWLGVAGAVLVASQWSIVALAQPLARNLAPVGGMLVIFAAVGVAALYERAFGRRLRA